MGCARRWHGGACLAQHETVARPAGDDHLRDSSAEQPCPNGHSSAVAAGCSNLSHAMHDSSAPRRKTCSTRRGQPGSQRLYPPKDCILPHQ
eukprot:scaffold220656_cov26-Tisochrysis_lutea.AAC.2